MASNKKASIKITADSDEAKKGIDNVTASLNKLSKNSANDSVSKLTKSVSGLNKAIQSAGWGAIIKAEVDLLKSEFKAIKDCSEAVNGQIKAEKQLETAAKNNPFINGESVQNLKEYANQLQSISDEDGDHMISMMTQLVAAGRNETEIMQIMSAAVDAAAGSGQDLDSIVQSLNKSYSGSAGQLSKLVPQVANLTKEQLESGEAVKLIQEAYDGQAKALSDATGSYKKMTDAADDFQKAVGLITKPAYDAWNNFWTGFYKYGVIVINKLNDLLNKPFENRIGKSAAEYANYTNADGQEYTKTYSNEQLEYGVKYLKQKKSLNAEQQQALILMQSEINYRKRISKWDEYDSKIEAENLKLTATTSENQTETKKSLLDIYNETVKKTEDEIAANEALGKTYDETAKKQELLNAKIAAFISYVQNGGDISSAEAQKIIQDITQLKESIPGQEVTNTIEDTASAYDELKDVVEKFADISIKEQIDELKYYKSLLVDLQNSGTLTDEQADKVASAIANIDTATNELLSKKTTDLNDYLNIASQFVNNFASTMSSISSMVSQRAEAEAEIQTTALEKQYAAGEVSEEEYYEKKEEIEKEAAEKAYKLQMWEWSASLLQIGVNTAQSITSALATKPATLGIVLASTMGILGAAQLAAAIANKPIPPSYATGGIVGGNSYSGDKVQANVNSGEMILNAQQQMALWKAANGGGGTAGNGINLQVKNYMGGQANVSSQLTSEGLKLIIRQTVASDMANGRLNSSFLSAQNSLNGQSYSS